MDVETPFRVAAAAVFVASMATAAYHRFQAGRSGEKVSRRDEGRTLFLAIRLGGLALLAVMLLYLVRPDWLGWAQAPLPAPVRWAGAALGLFSVWLLGRTLKALGKNLTDTVATRANHTLVVRGPYRWVRHPFYAAMLLLVGAVTLLSANWLLGAIGLTEFVLLAIRTPIEERKLVERFGAEYAAYMDRTNRYFPRWR